MPVAAVTITDAFMPLLRVVGHKIPWSPFEPANELSVMNAIAQTKLNRKVGICIADPLKLPISKTCARADVPHLFSPQFLLHADLLCKGSACRKNQDDMKCATSLRTHVTRMRSRVRTRVRACMCTTSQRVTCVRADFAHLLLPGLFLHGLPLA